jgi:hypothetical protein
MSSGYGPLDLKTKTGRLILKCCIRDKKKIEWKKTIRQTITCLNIRFKCGNYHNVLKPSHWKCNCDN